MGLSVQAFINSVSKDGENVTSKVNFMIQLRQQYMIGRQFLYIAVLDKVYLPHEGVYFGYIEAIDPMDGKLKATKEVVISLTESNWNKDSELKYGTESLSYGKILEKIHARNFSFPYPTSGVDECGRQTFSIYSGPVIPIIVKDPSTGKALPAGAYLEVYKKTEPGSPVPVYGQMKLELLNTDDKGLPIGMVDVQTPLCQGEGSYAFIGGLDKGDYYAKVMYCNKEVAKVSFKFPQDDC